MPGKVRKLSSKLTKIGLTLHSRHRRISIIIFSQRWLEIYEVENADE